MERFNIKGNGKNVVALFFLVMMGVFCVKSNPVETGVKLYEMDGDITMEAVKKEWLNSMWMKSSLINLNGRMARLLGMKGYYGELGIYVMDEQYVVASYPETTTDYEYEQVLELKEYLDERDINLLYVNAPTKYVDDSLMQEEFGLLSYSNQNADLFLDRITEAGINCLDLRDEIKQDGLNVYDMFYRTDHHWTTRSGLWATGKIAEALNEKCGYTIDTSIYDESNYTFAEMKECWLGEQGRKIAASYVGLDDFTVIKPDFPTSFKVTTLTGVCEGSFDIMIDETYYNTEIDVYETPSWHYSYLKQGVNRTEVHNNYINQGRILLLADSYSQVVVPFLGLGIGDISTLVLRGYGGDLKKYIEENDFDTVVILYAQFMIGAHDNPESANYNMFAFNKKEI